MHSSSDSLQDNVPSLIDATLDDLQRGLSQKHFTSVQLVQAYKARIAEVNSIFKAEKGARSMLHGLPFLLKDNIATLNRIEATSGSTVLLGTRPSVEAGVVKRLREAGAVILSTANLSEFAGFRHTNASTGWTSGSSTGSATSVGLGLTLAGLGTETVSSIVSPAEKSCVVGFKPTHGTLPTYGIIPVSHRQDMVGTIGRTVKDVAQILGVLVESSRYREKPDYAASCDGTDLVGVRIGVVLHPGKKIDPAKLDSFHEALALLKGAGAVIIDGLQLAGVQEYEALSQRMKDIVLETDFKASMDAYLLSLAKTPRRILTLQALVRAITNDPSEDIPARNVDVMQRALGTSTDAPDYTLMLQNEEYYSSSGGFEGTMDRHDCGVLIAPAGSLTLQTFASIGGNPVITVPMGIYPDGTKVEYNETRGGLVLVAPGIRFSLFLYGRKHRDPRLLRVAHAFEQLSAARKRARPYKLPESDLKDFIPETKTQRLKRGML
ncbi:amidase signature domain-containing protein [Dactylonectria macrodidyma]|uniref:Amidase signature domain-containing protein n=1 Tax=Dactylonectria macrodidyma TaxID=307937 RepID=A0A9P9DXN2_9HYPO|nr:amidase signature domain-containing protein [Dactylonectria macrodidyma]